MGLKRALKRILLGQTDGVKRAPLDARGDLDANYYQGLHEQNKAYQSNNWLMEEPALFDLVKNKSVLELGCGNGQFSHEAAKTASHVYALDWAKSPALDEEIPNLDFMQGDALTMSFPEADVACSGDVLEHFKPEDVPALLAKLHAAADVNYHVIACYDDKHSHLTVEPKEWWLAKFQAIDPSYRLLNTGTEKREIARISNA